MISFEQYDAAIFDLDGVITDTAPLHYQAWKALAEQLNIPFELDDNEQLKGVDRMNSLEFILNLGNVVLTDDQKQKLANEKNEHYKLLLKQLSARDVLPGVRSVLEKLKQLGLKIGLASASRNAPDILHALDLFDKFDHIANPEIARSKPAPDIFLYAASGVGVHPEKCIAFEDAIAGLRAIRASSMYAVSVGDIALAQYSDKHISSFIECC